MSSLAVKEGTPSLLTPPAVITVPEQRAAIIRLTIPRSEMRTAMPVAIAEVRAALQAQAIPSAGPLFAHHLRTDSATFDFEVGFAINQKLAETGRVRLGSLPGATLARATYSGGYEGLSSAWEELRGWVEANGHVAAPDLWEVYASGPESGAPDHWRTELNQPLKDGTTVERTSELDLIVTRTISGAVRRVFEAWTKPDLFQKMVGAEILRRLIRLIRGRYPDGRDLPDRDEPPVVGAAHNVFGRYLDVTPPSRIAWTNDEAGEQGAVTTVSFEEKNGATQIVVHELYASKQALDEAMASGSTSGWGEQFAQLKRPCHQLNAEV